MTKHCPKCNSILVKHEIDVCSACTKEACKPTPDELEELKEVLDNLEKKTLQETGVKGVSGGFAVAEYFDYDESFFDIELKWGVQNDVEDRCNKEQYKINRKTMGVEDD